MKKILILISALLVAAGTLQAATITQTKTFSGSPNYSSILTFNKFDDAGGTYTLNSIFVSVVLNTAAGASLGIDNDGQNPASGTASFGSNGGITASDVTLLKQNFSTFYGTLVSTSSKQMTLAADDGDSTTFSTSGTDYDALVTSATSVSDNAYLSSAVFDQYKGNGTYTVTYGVNQYLSMGAFSGAQFQGNPVSADGSMSIQYNYTIPEPASASLTALIFVAGFWIRRRFLA
ncbi:MAG: choice-of-anchor E domain-containing protein [Kiritimatiellaceae bacterium]|nr:choice-of-anchor E domain-containing protein [Kiritimatiellaceae bacterium]